MRRETNCFLHWLPLSRNKNVLPIDKHADENELIERLAEDKMTDGCSGRELGKILHGVSSAVNGTDECILTEKIWSEATETICNQMAVKRSLKWFTLINCD